MRPMPLPALALAAAAAAAAPATAEGRIPSHCIALSRAPVPGPTLLHRAAWRDTVARDSVRITYLDHAMFLIQTPRLSAVTDFTGFVGNVDFIPDVVTMNNAHSTHWTPFPDPAIPHVLRGWAPDGAAADHHLDLGEMLVRNVPTDIRAGGGARADGNSIFVFEAAGLCIGHLGHLHHEPTPEDYAALGRVDVVMVPVDGGLTLDMPTLIRVLTRLRARIMIPMHWFGPANLDVFLAEIPPDFAIVRTDSPDLTLTLADLPDQPRVIVLTPRLLAD
jgi:L-ascorbate metabolism protein UlaG (beta-lactamase superfamily)